MALCTADVLHRFLPAYRQHHKLSPQQAKVSNLLQLCRTPALGGQRWVCDDCHTGLERYHSCRNRHCPKCQQAASQRWLAARVQDVLPVPYFHLVFTLPHCLNGWVQLHPDALYRLLFKAVAQTLQRFGSDPKRLDGELGFTSVLHTWGQNLSQHVHLHCLVAGGAFNAQAQAWKPARSTYLFPVKALSRHVRGLFVSLLRQAWDNGELSQISGQGEVQRQLRALMQAEWVVYGKPTCHRTEATLAYLARYTYRIAISDSRLVTMDAQAVRFRYTDYADNSRRKTMQLQGEEFVRRWLLHVLPAGFMRIRHYGFLANCHRQEKLVAIRAALAAVVTAEGEAIAEIPVTAATPSAIGQPCPCCGARRLRLVGYVTVRRR